MKHVRRGGFLLAFCLLGVTALRSEAPKPLAEELPLPNLRVDDGTTPQVVPAKDGFIVKNRARIRADVACAPDAFPCRLSSGDNPDLCQLSIGRVNSLRCNSLYSPERDEALTFEASESFIVLQKDRYKLVAQGPVTVKVTRDFMKKTGGVKWFKPLDKSAFSRAPAGWCSWYIYWEGITEQEVVKNTDWLADKLKKFGCEYVQIDDGWQGTGRGGGDNRDWYITNKTKFPHGMKWRADYIRSKGFKPGIWLIPFATSNDTLFRDHPEMFIRNTDRTTVGIGRDPKTGELVTDWTGRYIVDPTSEGGQKWFRELFTMICSDWGYDYVKIDGQAGSHGACQRYHKQLANPKLASDEAYRAGLAAIKSVMGHQRFLLNCGAQFVSCGYCEGIRTGTDVRPSWQGMQPAIGATMAHLYRNNIAFWTDPDVLCVRPAGNNDSSLTLDQARVWASLYGITGQLLMVSDKMYELPGERVELLRRIYPVADIRPIDLYPFKTPPRIFDLRIAKPGVGTWDVVALFNWNAASQTQITVDPRELGLPTGMYVFYDFWEKKLLAVTNKLLPITLAPTSCRIITIRAAVNHPQLLGTSRHITQGADDLIEAKWSPITMTWSGRSQVVGGDPYEIRFYMPRGWSCRDNAAKIDGSVAVLTLKSDKNEIVSWQVGFRKGSTASSASS